MAKVTVELSTQEIDILKKLALKHKRTPRAQAEWMLIEMLADQLASWSKVCREENEKLREIFPCRGVAFEPSAPSDAEYSEGKDRLISTDTGNEAVTSSIGVSL